jgi:uncharacterized membrane protein
MPPRLAFLDAFRGVALIVMVLNHTGRWWIDRPMGWWRYWLVYVTMAVAAPIFLFLVGFVLPLSLHRNAADIMKPSRLWTYWRRGATIIGAGLLLNIVVFGSINLRSLSPEDSPLAGGVLQTIGLAIVVMTPTAALLRWRWGGVLLLAAAAVAYLSFVAAFEPLKAWLPQHPLLALTLFLDYPPWPWLSIVLVGLVLGWWWRDVAARGDDARYFKGLAGVGAALVVVAVACELRWPHTPRIGFTRDFSVNHHWVPAPITALWILGTVLLMLAAAYWIWEVRRLDTPWLVMLGQTALMLYFVHQIIAYTILGERGLHLNFLHWWQFWVTNIALMLALVGLGYGWRAVKARSKGWAF